MKLFLTAAVFVVVFSILETTEFSEEEIRMFLPYIKRSVPPSCPMNEMYKTCVSGCSDCTQRGRCIVRNCKEGCDCAPRFFRVKPDGPCEPVANCPKPECGDNEVFRECGPVCETCTTFECHVISCDHKCYCKEGYYRTKEGICIPKEECPTRTRCSRTEEWAESGPVNEFCIPGVDEGINISTQNISRCYCKEGHKRNLMGYCVNETACPVVRCIGFEVYQNCIPKCNTTCRNYGNPNCTEDDNCHPGCFCPPGYVMNDFRSCIEIDKCSLDIDQLKIINSAPEEDIADTTLPPTCAPTDSTTLADDSTDADDIATSTPVYVNDTEVFDSEEDTKAEESEQTLSTASTTSVSGATANEKANKKDKVVKNKERKHENVAKEKTPVKYVTAEDEEGFENFDY